MENFTKILVICLVVSAVYQLVLTLIRRKISEGIIDALLRSDLETFDKKIDSNMVKLLIPGYNVDYLKMNRYMMTGENDKLEEIFSHFKTGYMTQRQKLDAFGKAYNYYLFQKNKEECTWFRDAINNLKQSPESDRLKAMVNTSYDVVIEKKTDMLEPLLEATEKLPEEQRSFNDYLLSEIYLNLKDQTNADKYQALSRKHMAMAMDSMEKQRQQQEEEKN